MPGTTLGVGTVIRVPGDDLAVRDGLFVIGDEPALIGGRCRDVRAGLLP